MTHFQVAHVAEEESCGWDYPEASRIGIVVFLLGGLRLRAARLFHPRSLYIDVGELHILDGMIGDAGDNRALALRCVETDEIADQDPPEGTDFGALFRPAQARTADG